MGLLEAYRRTGADLPLGDPTRAHGVAMEGYFWRLTSPDSGRCLVALIGVNRGPQGPWATVGLAAHGTATPYLAVAAHPGAWASTERLAAGAGHVFTGDAHSVRVDLGTGQLDVGLDAPLPWPRRRWGGSSVFQCVPALNQYWHPWLLGGSASGSAVVAGEVWDLDGWQAYGEKNWGRGGFPASWWWGQAQGFTEPDACVAFAGGELRSGPLHTTVTGLVVRLPGGRLVRLGDPLVSPVRARVADDTWTLRGRGYGWRVDLDATAPLADAHVLPVPLPAEGRNTAGAIEHLGGFLHVRVRRWGRSVWEGRSPIAGLEHGGLARAEAELRRRGVPSGAVGAPPVPPSAGPSGV